MDAEISKAESKPVLVELDQEHPGFRDTVYRQRRNKIAAIAQDYRGTGPIPAAPYIEEEHQVWKQTYAQLDDLHQQYACDAYLNAQRRLTLSRTEIPQLSDVNAKLTALGGFSMSPVAGLVTPEVFLRRLADKVFLSTQYIRHYSKPGYTPEPDVIHELIGHAPTFADDDFCSLTHAFGQAAQRASTSATLERLIRVYWYTLEFGLVREGGAIKAYGAGLLSSTAELQKSVAAGGRAFDLEIMASTTFDPTTQQDTYFVAPSWGELVLVLGEWLACVGVRRS